jgi:thiol-disulfide isomerase/thioredoxin
MNTETFERGTKVEPFLDENLKNYYFKKKYQRYDPMPGIIPAMKSISSPLMIAVGTTKKCPYCIATVPMMVRIVLDAENDNVVLRMFDNTKGYMPPDFEGLHMPQFFFYDSKFNLVLSLDDATIKENFEHVFLEKINKLL